MPDILAHILRVFKGPRHDRLENIWRAVTEYTPHLRLLVTDNWQCRRHDNALELAWMLIRRQPERYALITEFDFLPNLSGDWLPTHLLTPEKPVVIAQHVWRSAQTRALIPHEFGGAWYILIDKHHCPDLQGWFRAGIPPRTDPATNIDRKTGVTLLPAKDLYPEAYSVEYSTGIHCFWSRHLHDDPRLRVAGCPLGDIQEKHDRLVDRWVTAQPEEFRQILCPSDS